MSAIRVWAATKRRKIAAATRRQLPFLVLGLFLLLFALVFFFERIVISIRPGELGVLWRRLGGGTQLDTVYREGLHVILPINQMYIYNVRKQQFTDTISVLTLDGLSVGLRFSVRYYLEADTLPLLHQRVGPDYVSVVVRPEVRAVMRVVFGQYKPEEIYATQNAIQERISVLAKSRLESRFVGLDGVPIESITLPTRISEAIEAKLAQEQVDQEYVFRLSIATKEAERKRIESNGIQVFNDQINPSLSPAVLSWHGIVATESLAKSTNAKVVVIGSGANGLPLILGKE